MLLRSRVAHGPDRKSPRDTLSWDLHDRICQRDHEALEFLGEYSLRVLGRQVGRAFPRVADDVLHDSIVDALMDYISRPE